MNNTAPIVLTLTPDQASFLMDMMDGLGFHASAHVDNIGMEAALRMGDAITFAIDRAGYTTESFEAAVAK